MRYYSIVSTTLVMCAGTVSSNVVNRNESADSVSPIMRLTIEFTLTLLAVDLTRHTAHARDFYPLPSEEGKGLLRWSLIGDC